MFATELAGQVALRHHEYAKAIETFESLRAQTNVESRVWLVFSYRLADALAQSGDHSAGLALLEDLLQRIERPTTRHIDDVEGRILYRVALTRHIDGAAADAIALAARAAAAFARSGIITSERRATVMLWADLLSESGARAEAQQLLIATRDQAEKEGDFEMLTEIRQRLADDQSGGAIPSSRPPHLADL